MSSKRNTKAEKLVCFVFTVLFVKCATEKYLQQKILNFQD